MKKERNIQFCLDQSIDCENLPFEKQDVYIQGISGRSMEGSVIQGTGKVEFEGSFWIGNHPKLKMLCRGSTLYLGYDKGQCAHPGSFGD